MTEPNLLTQCRIEARRLLKRVRSKDKTQAALAAARFRRLRSFAANSFDDLSYLAQRVQLKHALAVVAEERGFESWPALKAALEPGETNHKTASAAAGTETSSMVKLAVLAVRDRAARCRDLATAQEVTLRAERIWHVYPGEVVTVRPHTEWHYNGHAYLSGEIESVALDAAALGLEPLTLENVGLWDPREHYWGEPGEEIGDWAEPIMARGPRPEFRMNRVLPGEDPDDPFRDPIIEAVELEESGNRKDAHNVLMDLCQADLRCLDAHAHLGNFMFESLPKAAIRHFAAGLRIGELSLPDDFNGLLPWGHIDNRPFLRCLHAYGLCLWRLGRVDEAEKVFDRMLWLNPADNQGARFLLDDVKARMTWEESTRAAT